MTDLQRLPRRPASRRDFEVAVICALTLEADAVEALFDHDWDDDGPYDKAPSDPNTYSTGAIGRHNIVLVYMPGMGKANAAVVAANCRSSFPNIRLAVVVGVCGAVPFYGDGVEIVLGDVIVSDGVIQYDLGLQLPEQFKHKDRLLDSLGRPNIEIRSLLAKLKGILPLQALQNKMAGYLDALRTEPKLAAEYPGTARDKLFNAAYRHVSDGMSCDECKCDGPLVPRSRLEKDNPQPAVHFGLIASGDTVMKSGEDRDRIAREKDIVGFEMEGAGVWDSFPCIVIKGVCDYADSHKSKGWQRYAAATAAACMKALLSNWVPSLPSYSEAFPIPEQPARPFVVPYPRNDAFIGREPILKKLQQRPKPTSQSRTSLFGLGGIGKTQIALEYAYWLRETCADVSVFWVHGSSVERFRQSYTSIAIECRTPGYNDPKVDVLPLVKAWLEKKDRGQWLMVIDNADDTQLFFPSPKELKNASSGTQAKYMGQYVPECAHGSILVTTRNKQVGQKLAKGKPPIEIDTMNDDEAKGLLRASLSERDITSDQLLALACRLEHLPLALVQAAAFIEENTMAVSEYLRLLDRSDQDLVDLLSEEFETVGRDSKTSRAVAETWILSFEQIHQQDAFASELLSLMSFFDRQAIPIEFLDYYSEQQDHEKHRGGWLQKAFGVLKAFFSVTADYYSEQQGQEHAGKRLQKALGILKAFSFVTAGQDQSLNVHRLVQLVSRKWLVREKRMKHFSGQALLAVSHAYPSGNYENWAICSEYLPHAYQVLEFEGTGSIYELIGKGKLLHNAASYLLYQGQWNAAEKLQLEAVEVISEVSGADHGSTLISMGNLASTYRNQGRWEEAEKLEVQVMETFKTKRGADHPSTLTSMANLALTYINQGRWEEAEKLQVQVIETFKMKLGADHPSTLTSMANLASTYMDQGRWEEAEKLEVQVIETFKTKLGADHPSTLTGMANLASTYKNQGRWEEAEKLQVQVMETFKTKLGADHPDTLISMHNLAFAWKDMGRHDDALSLMDTCFNLQKRVLGNHPRTISTLEVLVKWRREESRRPGKNRARREGRY